MGNLKDKIYCFIENEMIKTNTLEQCKNQLNGLKLFFLDVNTIEDIVNKKIKLSDWKFWSSLISYCFICGSNYEQDFLLKSELFTNKNKEKIILDCFVKLSTHHPFNLTSVLINNKKFHLIEKIKKIISADIFMKLRKNLNYSIICYNKNISHEDLYYFSENIAIDYQKLNFERLSKYWEIDVLLKINQYLMLNSEVSLVTFKKSCELTMNLTLENLFLLIENAGKFRDFNVLSLKLSCLINFIEYLTNKAYYIFDFIKEEDSESSLCVNFRQNIFLAKQFVIDNINHLSIGSESYEYLYLISIFSQQQDVVFFNFISEKVNKNDCVVINLGQVNINVINHFVNVNNFHEISKPERFFIKISEKTNFMKQYDQYKIFPLFFKNAEEKYLEGCCNNLIKILDEELFVNIFNSGDYFVKKIKFPFEFYTNILSLEFLDKFQDKFNSISRKLYGLDIKFIISDFEKVKETIKDRIKIDYISDITATISVNNHIKKTKRI